MKQSNMKILIGATVVIFLLAAGWQLTRKGSSGSENPTAAPDKTPHEISEITVAYPADGSIFPPEFPPPTWLWHDPANLATAWVITVAFADGTESVRVESKGERLSVGKSDPRAASSNNRKPALSAQLADAHTWKPDDALWKKIKSHSVTQPATVTIEGHVSHPSAKDASAKDVSLIVSKGDASIHTSADPVGAPIFYRDVPLMPSENEKGVIKPLAAEAVPLIAWRLRDIDETKSRLLMDGIHTCANCHSFSANGRTLGMDMDGPRNDKGLYALVDIEPEMSVGKDNLIEWRTFRGKLGSRLRVGFMSQLSPDASHVITTVNDPGIDQSDYDRQSNPIDLIRNYYVANFTDYRFLQVFFPTRGVLAWYSRESRQLNYLPGADDTEYVHTNAVWSPDGEYLVFARAAAGDANPKGATQAQYAGDPNERQLKYDLYRIAFNAGKGGTPEPIVGASQNGMSNSFPKVSPDGRWIVYVQSKNGLLMRPDGQLYIVPAKGGAARRMTCNTPLMNSWHSFSPNGKWMVFSSKSRSPYTQLYLTHIDDNGNDSPAILIENTTAANRAANIPEFVNIPKGGLIKIDAPAAKYAEHLDKAIALMKNGNYADAASEWQNALALAPDRWQAHNSLGVALMELGRVDDAISHYREALESNPAYPEAFNNLGEALTGKGAFDDAVANFKKAIDLNPKYAVAHTNLGTLLARNGRAG
ncbi:MAG: tetratricopeptide repeat protein, partial [Deltaproteobacteria bacterium]|nr:tetratricopeptide repeat protein [Deltaproteobacteria bacterium]